jgi:hypothetical protein
MTMPHLSNCEHHDTGWCLGCVRELWEEKELAQTHVDALQKDIATMKYLEDESQHGVDELRRKLEDAETKLTEYMRDNATICYQCGHAEPANVDLSHVASPAKTNQ